MPTKPLIAIAGCVAHRYMHQVYRETCLKDCPMDYRFFAGRGFTDPLPDEVVLDVEDDFVHLIRKIMGMAEWTLAHSYSHMLRCDNDTYVCVPRLLRSGFEKYSVVNGYGGAGMWLDRLALQKLLALRDSPVLQEWEQRGAGAYDDHFISQNIGISHEDSEHYVGNRFDCGPTPLNEVITFHNDQGNSLRFDAQGNPNGGRMRTIYALAKGIQ